MNFKEWSKKFYPNESEETLHKMSHAWAAAHVSFAASEIYEPTSVFPNNKLKGAGCMCIFKGNCRSEHTPVCEGCEYNLTSPLT